MAVIGFMIQALVMMDLWESNSTRVITVGFLDTSCGRADLQAASVATCFLGALTPADLWAVYLVPAILDELRSEQKLNEYLGSLKMQKMLKRIIIVLYFLKLVFCWSTIPLTS
jgi:hypothetical protein